MVCYLYGCDDGEKGRNEVVHNEEDNVCFSRCALHVPFFASVAFDAYLLSEGAWVLWHILKPVLRSQNYFQNIGETQASWSISVLPSIADPCAKFLSCLWCHACHKNKTTVQ